jgi:hypothetical protein
MLQGMRRFHVEAAIAGWKSAQPALGSMRISAQLLRCRKLFVLNIV